MSGTQDFDDDFGDDWDDSVLADIALAGENETSILEEQNKTSVIESKENEVTDVEIVGSDYVSDTPEPQHLSALHRLFGHQKFRPLQWKIISSILNDKKDNCAIMSTGYGKSLCFQYPSAFTGGVTFVISPLISLMEDQVLSLTVSNISACLLGTANLMGNQTYDEISENKYRVVYLTPEFCNGDVGRDLLQKWSKTLNVTLIAIDEAHCVSSWGHDFRHAYRKLGELRDIIPNVPILAVTATATKKIRKDIIQSLKLRNPQLSVTSFDRPNFYFEVNPRSDIAHNNFKKVMVRCGTNWKFSGPTIVYCITRKATEEISILLSDMGVKCAPYHAALSLKVRKETHVKFVKDEIEAVVATIAYGMGIDKPDIRNIIHYGISNSIESYYQEVGRAGRDGQRANCISFWARDDFRTHGFLRKKSCTNPVMLDLKEKMIEQVQNYLETTKCRRQFILNYFEEEMDTSNRDTCCDNCQKITTQTPNAEIYEDLDEDGKYDFSADARLLLTAIDSVSSNYGLMTYVQVLRGSKQKKLNRFLGLPIHGAGKAKQEIWWKELGELMIKHKLLKRTSTEYSVFSTIVQTTATGREFLNNTNKKLKEEPTQYMLTCLNTKDNIWQNRTTSVSYKLPSTSTNMLRESRSETHEQLESRMNLYRILLDTRAAIASKENCMPHMVLSNKALMDMAQFKPKTLKEMKDRNFNGFTTVKLDKFGQEFLNAIVPNDEKLSIEHHLINLPLPEVTKLNNTTLISYSLFKAGKNIKQIAEERGFSTSTIETHLNTCLKHGYKINLSAFDITYSVAEKIIEAIYKVDTGLTLVMPVKMACPEEISFGQIKSLISYLEIREHLTSKNIPYEEFDDPRYYEMFKNWQEKQSDGSELDLLLKGMEAVKDKHFNSESEIRACLQEVYNTHEKRTNEDSDTDNDLLSEIDEPILKKSKIRCDSFLDSPPRNDGKNEFKPLDLKKSQNNSDDTNPEQQKTNNIQTSTVGVSKKKADIKIPPWLTTKRVA